MLFYFHKLKTNHWKLKTILNLCYTKNFVALADFFLDFDADLLFPLSYVDWFAILLHRRERIIKISGIAREIKYFADSYLLPFVNLNDANLDFPVIMNDSANGFFLA